MSPTRFPVLVLATLFGFSALAADREETLRREAPGLRQEALRAALASWETLAARGEARHALLTVIDYGLPSTAKRMWVFDLTTERVLFHDLVAHGKNSGDDLASSFSNDDGSLKSSLGAFVTGVAYDGRHGYSLRLRGTEPGVNDRAEDRAIVLHGAPYVDDEVAKALGRLGRSFGCPAVRPGIARPLIDAIKGGSVLYAWHPSIAASGGYGSSSSEIGSEKPGTTSSPSKASSARIRRGARSVR